MNKIIISKDSVICDSDNVRIEDSVIRLLKSDIYFLEYQDIDNIKVSILVSDNIDAIIYESCFLGDINVNNKYVVDSGKLKINKFYNNDSVLENIDIELYNQGKIEYRFSNICKNNESYTINVNHNGIGTVSNINNRSIAMDKSKIDFVINSIVKKEYEKSILDQNTRVVTLGDCDAKISPNMFIDCDDIEARHGSVIGTFKDDLVFYLMSRGISYNDSIKLLIKGYLFSNMDLDSNLREKILNVIDMYWR